ncbi:MAG: hypothetical protein IJQ23_04165 [Clostridia bacterium]|nr:hypothetical protein [Clostridia bacterium]
MKKKLVALALVLALAVSALSLVACGGSDFSKTYKDMSKSKLFNETVGMTKILNTKTDLTLDYEVSSELEGSNLVVFSKETDGKTTQNVYSLADDKSIAEFKDTDTVTYGYVEKKILLLDETIYDYFTVEKTTSSETGDTFEKLLYSADGSLVATTNDEIFVLIDTIFVGNDYYRIKNGKFEKAGSLTNNAKQHLGEFNAANDGRYYAIKNNEFYIFNDSFVLTNYYQAPSYADKINFFVLEDGNVLIQYTYAVSPFDNDYTYSEGMNNIKVITQVYNVKDSKTKDVDAEGVFSMIYSRNTNYAEMDILSMFTTLLDDGIKNIGTIQYVTNKRLDENTNMVILNNDVKEERNLTNLFLAAATPFPEYVSDGRFIIYDKTGAKYLVNSNGKILADITGAEHNQKYFVFNGKIYDLDFKEITGGSFDEEKWDVQLMNNTVVLRSFENDRNYKIFADGVFKEITLDENQEIVDGNERYYVIVTENTETGAVTYSYYNENGVKLLDSAFYLDNVGTARNGKVLLNGYDATNEKYVNIVLSTVEAK